MEISERMGNCAVRFLSNETSTNTNANSKIIGKRKSFKEVFLLIFVSLSLNLPTQFICCMSCHPERYCPRNGAVRQFDWWIPLATHLQ